MRSIHELLPAPARTEYVSNADYRRQKTALTRAINSRVAVQVLRACEKVIVEWRGKAWPDDWSRWARALEDAYQLRVRIEAYGEGPDDPISAEETERWRAAAAVLCR